MHRRRGRKAPSPEPPSSPSSGSRQPHEEAVTGAVTGLGDGGEAANHEAGGPGLTEQNFRDEPPRPKYRTHHELDTPLVPRRWRVDRRGVVVEVERLVP